MRNSIKYALGLIDAEASGDEEQPSSLLLHDQFTGASGALADHLPDTVWTWDGWQIFGSASGAWTLTGSGGVSQTFNPGAGTGRYNAKILAATQAPLIQATLTTPASGDFRSGVIARYSNDNNYWMARLNSVSDVLEIVQVSSGSEVQRATAAITLDAATEYVVEFECVEDLLTARCGEVSCNYTSSTNQENLFVGLTESADADDGHSVFSSFSVEPSTSATVADQTIWYAPAVGAVLVELDAETNSGTADLIRDLSSGQGVWACTIDTSGGTSGTRAVFQADVDGQVPAARAAQYTKNLPDDAYYTAYLFVPAAIERTGNFWLIVQMKQRDSSAATWPVYSLNIGWTTDHMHLEPNSNMDSGAYNGSMPDLSETHYTLPAGQWVRLDMRYKWGIGDGRLTFWMDGTELWDFNNIQTQFNLPADGTWDAPQYPRQMTWAHYSDGLGTNPSTIYWDKLRVSVGGLPDDEYPVIDPV